MALHHRQLSDGDKTFIKLHQEGVKKSAAFKQAYPDHPAVLAWESSLPGTEARQKAAERIKGLSEDKLKTKYIQRALATYQDRMEEFSALSLETATELVQHARSEKVRADLAIEGIRHKIGTPVQKVAVQEQKTVYLTFSKPKEGSMEPVGSMEPKDIVEGEIIDEREDKKGTM